MSAPTEATRALAVLSGWADRGWAADEDDAFGVGKQEIEAAEATVRAALTAAAEREAALKMERDEAYKAINAIHPRTCPDCEGDGIILRQPAGGGMGPRECACESCYGNEDRRGDGYLPNEDVVYAEWIELPAVRLAHGEGKGGAG